MKKFSPLCAVALAVLTLCLPASGQDKIHKTTWEKLPILKPRFKETFYQIAFVSRDVGFMVSNQSVLKTTDGCQTWKPVLQATFLRDKPVSALHFSDDKNGCIVSGDKLYSTDDGGESWTPEDITNVNAVATGPDHWMIAGGGHSLYQKHGLQAAWETLKGKGPMPGMSPNDSVDRIAIGDAQTAFVHIWGLEARVIRTTDGGKHWETVFKKGIDSMHFADGKRGWLTVGAAIHATQDGGKTWKQQVNPEDRPIVTIAFDKAGRFGIAPLRSEGNQNRKVLSTADGKNWMAAELDLDEGNFVSASVVDGHAYLLMDNGRFIRFDSKK
jgi:photosystem II stability/assembly factor-like uncharacterized protein